MSGLRVEGDLELGPEGLTVDGDLEVTGSILDAMENEGAVVRVGGDLRARNAVVASSQFQVEGNAEVAELLLFHGGEWSFTVAGATRAGLTVDDAYFRPGFPLADYLHRDIPVERDLEEYPIAVERVDGELLIERIRQGLPVLRDADDPRPRKSYGEWLADCSRFGQAIADVPRELVTDELVDAALADNPWALQGVPEELRTAERCRIAVQHQGRMLAHVPLELRTAELCALAIDHDPRGYEVFPSIPEHVLTPELCLRAATRDGLSLGSMPERFRTFDVCVAAMKDNFLAREYVPESMREAVQEATRVPRVELTPEQRTLVERPSKPRLFLFVLKHLWRGFRSAWAPRRD